MIDTWIGCSGFHYKEWKEAFYPVGLPQRKWFDYYSQHFNTLELNTTFYRFPRVTTLSKWHEASPDLYKFSVKAPRLITHYKQFKDCKRMLDDFYGACREGLKDKLGCILFQLPQRVKYADEMLDRVIENMDPLFINVVEFREAGWWKSAVYKKLAAHHIHFCSISYPSLPNAVIQNTSLCYYRFHGVPTIYKSCYKKADVLAVADQLLRNKKTKQAYLYFNNTWGTGALRNARQLLTYVKVAGDKNSFSPQKTP